MKDALSKKASGCDCRLWRSNYKSLLQRCKNLNGAKYDNERIYPLVNDTYLLLNNNPVNPFEQIFNITGDALSIKEHLNEIEPDTEDLTRKVYQFRLSRWHGSLEELRTYLNLRLYGYNINIYVYPLSKCFVWSQVQLGSITKSILKLTGNEFVIETDPRKNREHVFLTL